MPSLQSRPALTEELGQQLSKQSLETDKIVEHMQELGTGDPNEANTGSSNSQSDSLFDSAAARGW